MIKILKDYKEYLIHRHARVLGSLDNFADVLASTLEATKLPEPQFKARHGAPGSGLVTVVWKQEVAAARPEGATTVTLRVELALHHSGLTFHVRDPRDAASLRSDAFFSVTNEDFQMSREFLRRATALAADPKVSADKWEATLYTY